jgi:AraC-like DNA-binding protein
MARPVREPASPSAVVPALLRYLAARGGDAAAIAARFGLAPGAADADEVDVAPSAIGELIEVAAETVGDPFLALQLPAALPLRRYGAAELAARASETVADSLRAFARYGALVHPQLELELAGADWHQQTPRHPRGVGRHVHEYALAFVLGHLRAATGVPIAPTRVWFAHARPRALAPLHRFFATLDLEFGAVDSGFTLPADALERRLITGDPRLLATATDLAELELREAPRSHELAPRVAAVVTARPAATIDAIAAALKMSARTLQRRLEAEGTTLTELVDTQREAIARRLIDDPELALAEIADRVGFADLATFTRAFKRWTGEPPGRFRQRR